MNPEQRAIALLELLSRRNAPMPVSRLAEFLGVSERTINYDLEALRQAGNLLRPVPGRNGGILLEQTRAEPSYSDRVRSGAREQFAGYERELDILSAALPAESGGSKFALITGEAGIGKTRLCEELTALASESGTAAIWGRCVDNEGAPPLWPWTQILRTLARSESANTVLQAAPADTARIAAHIPELSSISAAPPDIADLAAERAQFLLFDSIATMLQRFATQQPLVLILEDVQWADRSTLAMLEHVAVVTPISNATVIVTHRTDSVDSRFATTASDLRRAPGLTEIELRGLNAAGIARVISSITGIAPAPEAVESIRKLTNGNPFFVREFVRWSGEAGPVDGSAPSRAVREVVAGRLQPLGAEILAVLEMGSMQGREFDVPKLIACLTKPDAPDSARPGVLDALEAGITHRVIQEDPGEPDAYRFEHEITRQALYYGIPAPRRAEMHATIAERLETHYGNAAAQHAAELSHHSYMAGSAGPPERLKAWALTAGERALTTYSYEAAIEQFGRVIDPDQLGTSLQIDDAEGRALTGLGRAFSQIREDIKAVECLQRAFDYFIDAGQVDDAVGIASIHLVGQEGQLATIEIKEAALDLLGQNSVEAARIMASLARPVGVHLGDYERAAGLLSDAMEVARKESDKHLEMEVANHGIHVSWFSQRRRDTLDWCQQVLALSEVIDDPLATSNAEIHLSLIRFGEGAFEVADDHTRKAIQAAHDTHNRERISSTYKHRQSLAIQMCDWELARLSAEDSARYWPDDPRTLAMSAATEFLSGNASDGQTLLNQFTAMPTDQQFVEAANLHWLPVIARCTGETKHRDLVKTAANRALGADLESSNQALIGAAKLALVWMTVEESNQPTAAEILASFARVNTSPPSLGIAIRPALAHIAGQPEEADRLFDHRLEYFLGAGFTLAEAWLRFDYARFLTDNPGLKGSRFTRRTIAAGRRFASESRMPPLATRFEALENRLTATDVLPFGLSKREAEILTMIAGGQSNQQIADSLIISRHTVVRHVSNVFAKLDVNNRTEAATLAIEHDLTPGQK